MENLTVETFKEKVFDYTQSEKWSFVGKKPAIIDFYASWCQPCKTLSPILEELAKEYTEIDIYKVNTEEEMELAATFNIRSLPTLLFIPLEGEPKLVLGAVPKPQLKAAIEEHLLNDVDVMEDIVEEVVIADEVYDEPEDTDSGDSDDSED